MFNLNIKQALANQICCTHYMYIITQNEHAKTRQNVYFEMASKATTLLHTSFFITPMHSVCREDFFLSRTSLPEPILSGEGRGVNFQLFLLLRPPCIFTRPNWHMHNLAMGPII